MVADKLKGNEVAQDLEKRQTRIGEDCTRSCCLKIIGVKPPCTMANTLDVARHDTYFKQKRNAAKLLGFTSLQQVVAAVRMLTSGASAHVLDDKFRLTESTAIENLLRFCSAIISIYEPQVLRSPNVSELERLLQDEIADGFPGCIGLK
ncbi:hypothetical protein AC1031_021931 [Aphanomyces cochlioides]|nr:hypothetical protein AC1031_021931 [Aphanomyces cochlioides]